MIICMNYYCCLSFTVCTCLMSGFQRTALNHLRPLAGSSLPTSTPGGNTPGMGGAAPVLTNEKAQLLDVIDRLQNTLMDVSDIFNLAVQPYHLFVLALRMIQFSELSDPQRVATLWKSLIYRFVEVI
jgi:hypothetical protein